MPLTFPVRNYIHQMPIYIQVFCLFMLSVIQCCRSGPFWIGSGPTKNHLFFYYYIIFSWIRIWSLCEKIRIWPGRQHWRHQFIHKLLPFISSWGPVYCAWAKSLCFAQKPRVCAWHICQDREPSDATSQHQRWKPIRYLLQKYPWFPSLYKYLFNINWWGVHGLLMLSQ